VKRGLSNIVCPKCRGNIFFDQETNYSYARQQNEWTGWCLQCGYTLYLRVDNPVEEKVSTSQPGK
jgi:predicted nucleic-acid-binding Zn-ribbon protein